ncbi:hypothetical protein F2Q68_00038892 [Brassica cretica]|uniref:Uncharacterized protein n=1 Tax=Brassica cretica TaxID=69181 RepID=A0A3N6R7E5_BRACR|nr:hypothetical protein F2Q68_00038892 [Brassica cretica]
MTQHSNLGPGDFVFILSIGNILSSYHRGQKKELSIDRGPQSFGSPRDRPQSFGSPRDRPQSFGSMPHYTVVTDQKSDKASSSFWIVFRNFPAEFRSGYGEMKWGSWVFIDIFSE